MKKLQSFLAVVLCFMTAFVALVSANTKVQAANYPTKLNNIKKGAVLKYNGYDSLYYKTNADYKMLCTTFHTQNVGSSCSLASSQWSEPVQAGVAAIVKKYNSNKTQKQYYNAELAINEFLYYYAGKNSVNRISKTRDVRNTKDVKPYYSAAVNAYNKIKKSFAFKITNSKLTFSESGNYYVSNKITVKDSNGNLSSYTPTVSGVKGAEIYKKSGNSFYIRVPKKNISIGSTKTVKLSVKGVKKYNVAKRFTCGSNKQVLTPNTTTTSSKNKTVKLSGKITLKGNELTVYKRIKGTKTNLAGAKLVLKAPDGKETKWTSTTGGKTFKNLAAGTYTLSEESAPEGYEKTTEKIKITVAYDGKSQTKFIENNPKKDTVVKVIKLDAATNESLEGATLKVTDSKGKEVDKWKTTKEEHIVQNTKVGETYTLSEESAPEGYEKTGDKQTFKISNDGKTISLKVLNKKVITKAEILKIDSKTKQALAGATLVIKDSKGEIQDSWVSTTEAHSIEGLKAGKYTLSETIAPEGYEKTDEEKTFEIKYNGEIVKVELENKPIEIITKAKISKKDATTGEELPGAHLVIKDASGKVVEEWISTSTPKEFELDPGTYTLSETIAPEGYKLKTETIEFEVLDDGTVSEVVMYNSPEEIPDKPIIPDTPKDKPTYPVKISKQDITSKQELPGATLVIKDSDGNEIARWVSGNTPKEFKLEAGDYTLTEIQAPRGYDLSYEVINFTVETDNTVVTEAVMYNSKTPDTADKNIVLVVFGLLTTGIGTIFGFRKFKKQL